jgi:hypothetical protein
MDLEPNLFRVVQFATSKAGSRMTVDIVVE